MKPRSTNELRELFLDFFKAKGHQVVRSSPLLPQNDPTLLFANAGMNQFKDVFIGKEKRDYTRATSSQKCIRAGGKHNDLENVGFTKRHHTFFEMLGNFSFGDYFKEGAIELAWEFLTKEVGLPKEKLWVSVFRDDDEAAEIWEKKIGVPQDRIVRMDEEENFWEMGNTGPCGPCTEIHIDRGENFGKLGETIFDGGERFLEIWNLVFMQFDRAADGLLTNLPKPSVDTGMGLERLASIVQDVDSNYHIDSMQKIVRSFSQILGVEYGKDLSQDQALHVLTDHIRACTFAIADGIQPANEGRGYVLRRILRRAIRFGRKLGQNKPFFYKGVASVVEELGEAFPELVQNQAAVEKMIQFEEEKFFETLENGLKLLDEETRGKEVGRLSGEVAFKLYDTFGFPLDLTQMILKERGWSVDEAGFEKALEEQRERSRASWKGSGGAAIETVYKDMALQGIKSTFTGYESLQEETRIVGLLKNGQPVKHLNLKDEGDVILERTPFYAESGGQVGDIGEIKKGAESRFEVKDTQKPVDAFHVMRGVVTKGHLQVGDIVSAEVDEATRQRTMINHTTTHVLHATLREVLGEHVKQAGSLVSPDYLRFDFSHFKAVSKEERRKIEQIVNERIAANPKAVISEETMDDAIKGGAIAFFEEKYGDRVRVLTIGDFSKELCGGTHLKELGVAKQFKISQETSVASGVRRIVAVTADKAEALAEEEKTAIHESAQKLGVPPVGIYAAFRTLQGKPQDLEPKTPEEALDLIADRLNAPLKEVPARIEQLQKKRQKKKKGEKESAIDKATFENDVFQIENLNVIVKVVDVESPKSLRPLADQYKNHMSSGVIVLGAINEDKASVVVSLTKDIAKNFETKTFVGRLGEKLEGRGGGRDDFVQIGGTNTSFLTPENLKELLEEHLKRLQIAS